MPIVNMITTAQILLTVAVTPGDITATIPVTVNAA